MTKPWPERVVSALANPPTVLYHATTPRKLLRYEQTGAILPPVRGFDTLDGAKESAPLSADLPTLGFWSAVALKLNERLIHQRRLRSDSFPLR